VENISFDKTGKINLNDIYDNPTPIEYFSTLSKLEYRIPAEGASIFKNLIEAIREEKGAQEVKIVDLGCSYGVNAAILKHGVSLSELYRHYDSESATPARLIERDRALFSEPVDPQLDFVGIDRAANAVAYAVQAGVMDTGIATNLEKRDPTTREAEALADADLIISTGCIGYVTDASLLRLLDAAEERQPWMAHFVLRMFPFDPIEEMVREHGYVTEKLPGPVPQRRFASAEEQEHVLDNLNRIGVDPTGLESLGWYFAELHLSRPEADAEIMPLEKLLDRNAVPLALA